VIQKVMGSLTSAQIEQYNRNPRYVGIKLPDVSKPETLVKRYFGKLSKRALSFIKGVLKMDPAERMTSLECLEHPYFEGLPLRERDRAMNAAATTAGHLSPQSVRRLFCLCAVYFSFISPYVAYGCRP
jgi:serine/threonine protein kinase